MIKVELEKTVDEPIDEVFDRLVDISGYNEWMPDTGLFVSCTQDSPGSVAAGTRYTDVTRLGTVRGEVVEFERPHRVVFHYTWNILALRAMDGWPGYELKPEGRGRTRVRHVARGKLHGVFKLLGPLVQRIAESERRRTVRGLKKSFESD